MAKFALANMVTVQGAGPYEIVDMTRLTAVNKDVYYLGTINKIFFEEELELATSKIEEKILAEIEKKVNTPEELFKLIYSNTFQIPFRQFAEMVFKMIQDGKIQFNKDNKLEKKSIQAIP
jgi:hypothetical protein